MARVVCAGPMVCAICTVEEGGAGGSCTAGWVCVCSVLVLLGTVGRGGLVVLSVVVARGVICVPHFSQ